MATTYTANANLQKPATSDRNWDVPLVANLNTLDGLSAIGGLCVATTEVPSTTLNVKVAAGTYRKSDGTLISYVGTALQALAASTTSSVYLTDAGILTISTTGFPAGFLVRLATVVTGATSVTSITDNRVCVVSAGGNLNTVYLALAGGTFADGAGVVTVGMGTTNGVKLGAGATDKLGFWGAVPIVRPSGAGQAALTDSTGGTVGTTLAAVGVTNTGDVSPAINSNFATLANLVAALRTALVNAGLVKGSA